MLKILLKLIASFLLLVVFSWKSQGSHLVIGELSYKLVNASNNTYEITLIYYRDCRPPSIGGGNPQALQQDDPVYISIFNGSSLFSADSVASSQTEFLPLHTDCKMGTTPTVCISKMTFHLTKTLPVSTQPYTIVNQRCCFSESINNVKNPAITGFSFTTTIPPSVQNSSPTFHPVLDNFLCVHDNLSIDHSGVDPDGDSLSYELCDLPSGASPQDPKPYITSLPNITPVNFASPYSTTTPMNFVHLNSSTGLLTLEPQMVGNFLICVCCHEWRNGVLINTVRRAFLYQVNDCQLTLNAAVACDSAVMQFTHGTQCLASCHANRTVQFINQSTGQAQYLWDFGVPNSNTDTSTQVSPTFQYPSNGYFQVRLLAIQGTCIDTFIQTIYVGDDSIQANFLVANSLCAGVPIDLLDQSFSSPDSTTTVYWYLSNGVESVFDTGKQIHPILYHGDEVLIRQTVFNSNACYDIKEQMIPLIEPEIKAFNDTLIPPDAGITLYATGGVSYVWEYSGVNSILSGSTSNTIYPTTHNIGITSYIVEGTSADGCKSKDTVHVTVSASGYFIVPGAFSPNNDGLNDELVCLSSGYTLLEFKVYNRWGQQVFLSGDLHFKWHGDMDGKALAMDTYYWMAHIVNSKGQKELKKGEFVLVR